MLEPHRDGMHELVVVRDPACWVQAVCSIYIVSEWECFEMKDLWVEQPVHGGTWRIVGRRDDL